MKETQPRKHRPFYYSKTFLFVLLLVAVFLAKGAFGVYLKERESRKNAEEVSKELAALVDRKALLQEENEKLNTAEGVEQVIRQKFQVSREGEGVIVIVDKPEEKKPDEGKNIFSKAWSGIRGFFKK